MWGGSGMETLKERKILVIDDDRILCDLVMTIFSNEGAQTFAAYGGKQGLREFYNLKPDLVLLDQMMPDMNGMEVLERLRELSDVPIIMLSVLDAYDEIVRCLMAGADDYVTKPYKPQILVARAYAALRRSSGTAATPKVPRYDDGYLMYDLGARIVKVAGKDVQLSATEFALLAYLIRNAGRACTFMQIFENVWGSHSQSSEENVHTFVYQLRQKVERDPGDPAYLISLRSIGYRFEYPLGDISDYTG